MEEEKKAEARKEKTTVTRKEFYICFVILLLVIIWGTNAVSRSLTDCVNQNKSLISAEIDRLFRQIYGISDEVTAGINDANNPLQENDVRVVSVDAKKKTATLRLTAMPKEYQEGMKLTFFVSCDGKEPLSVAAEIGADRIFAANLDIPFCEDLKITANVKEKDTEYIQNLGERSMEGQLLPYFDGYWGGAAEWNSNEDFATIDGNIEINIQNPEWWYTQNRKAEYKNARVEVQIDGKKVKTIPAEWAGGSCHAYITKDDKIKLHEGETVAFIFKTEAEGFRYSYLIERGTFSRSEGYVSQDLQDYSYGESNSRLVVE